MPLGFSGWEGWLAAALGVNIQDFQMNDDKIKIMVIDDQAIVRQGFVALINTVSDMVVVAEGTNGQQAIELYRQHRPDVTLMDLRMPQIGGAEALVAIRKECRDPRLTIL